MASVIETLAAPPPAADGTAGPEDRKLRSRVAQALIQQGMDLSPVQSWTQGAARIVQALVGGYMGGELGREERAQGAALGAELAKAPWLNPGAAGPTAAPLVPDLAPPKPVAPLAPAGAATPSPMPPAATGPMKPVRQATEGIVSAVTEDGQDIAPYINGTGSPPATAGQPAPGAAAVAPKPMPTPGSAPVPAPAAAAVLPTRSAPQIDPQTAVYIKGLLLSGDPVRRAYGQQLAALFAKPTTPKFSKLDEGTLFDESTGQTKPVNSGAYRPLVTAEERAAHGIPPEDKRPYQLGPGGKLINPPAETRFTVDQRGESQFGQTAGKLNAERFNDIVKQASTARENIGQLNALQEIGARLTTGKTAEVKALLGPYAEALGIKIDGLGDLQAYKAIVSKMAPQMRVPGSGATSDFEMRTFLEALPSLGKTAEGNALVSQTLQALAEAHVAAGQIASRALTGEITQREAEQQLRALPDPMALWKKKHGASPTAPVSPEQLQDIKTKYGLE